VPLARRSWSCSCRATTWRRGSSSCRGAAVVEVAIAVTVVATPVLIVVVVAIPMVVVICKAITISSASHVQHAHSQESQHKAGMTDRYTLLYMLHMTACPSYYDACDSVREILWMLPELEAAEAAAALECLK